MISETCARNAALGSRLIAAGSGDMRGSYYSSNSRDDVEACRGLLEDVSVKLKNQQAVFVGSGGGGNGDPWHGGGPSDYDGGPSGNNEKSLLLGHDSTASKIRKPFKEKPRLVKQGSIQRLTTKTAAEEAFELSESTSDSVSIDSSIDDAENPRTRLLRILRISLLVASFFIFATFIVLRGENDQQFRQVTVQKGRPYVLTVPTKTGYPVVVVTLKGAFLPEGLWNLTSNRLSLDLLVWNGNRKNTAESFSGIWEVPVVDDTDIGKVPESVLVHNFYLKDLEMDSEDEENASCEISIRTNLETTFPLSIDVDLAPDSIGYSTVFAAVILFGLYTLIGFEITPRTVGAILAAVWAIGTLSFLDQRPTLSEIISWVDMETELLLFGMMIIVSIFGDTGFFDYVAMLSYKIAGGKIWPLITSLCVLTSVVSAFLDNVTCVLLLTPVSILLCKAMELDPRQILIAIVIFSNIGGASTAVGDPPNVIIVNNKDVAAAGVNFASFTFHMAIGIAVILVASYIHLRVTFRDLSKLRFSEPYDVAELRREVEIWQRTARSMSTYSDDERMVRTWLLSKRNETRVKLRRRLAQGQTFEEYQAHLIELQGMWRIRDYALLVKSGVVLLLVMSIFFLHSLIGLNLSLGLTAVLGALLLLILSDRHELESVLIRVEWSTLIFFAALFIDMEALARLGLLDLIGAQTERLILMVTEEWRLTASILLIQWISALASAFIDNIPFTTMMVQIIAKMSQNPALGLPLQPLVYALAFGTCLGGNGTLIGASANVVCAGLAEQHGYRFTFCDFFRIGFPIMITCNVVASAYLLICHIAIGWNS